LIEAPGLAPHEIEWNKTLVKVRDYYGDTFKKWILFDENSQVPETKEKVVAIQSKYDIVFIDGDHSYEGVNADTNLYMDLADKLLIYHDIAYTHSIWQTVVEHDIHFDYDIRVPNTGEGIGIQVIK
jgi:hypothetical protein